jgi:hypothetical protein
VDSALRYAHLKEEIAAGTDDAELRLDAALDLAQRYLISGMYHTALETVNAADTASVRSPRLQATYYQTLNSIYHGMALAAKDPEMATRFRAQELLYQRRSRAALTEDMLNYYTVNADIEIENGHPERARQLMEERLADERLSLQGFIEGQKNSPVLSRNLLPGPIPIPVPGIVCRSHGLRRQGNQPLPRRQQIHADAPSLPGAYGK